MEVTKNDLSAGIVKLDYEALEQTASIAYGLLKQEVNHYLNLLDDNDVNKDNTGRHCNARWILRAAKRLAVAAETYSTLVEGRTRSEKKIVNIPEISETTEADN